MCVGARTFSSGGEEVVGSWYSLNAATSSSFSVMMHSNWESKGGREGVEGRGEGREWRGGGKGGSGGKGEGREGREEKRRK